jgi:flagellar FliL protein
MAGAAESAGDGAAAGKGGKKKLMIIIGAVLVLALIGGGGALMVMKKNSEKAKAELNAAREGEEGEGEAEEEAPAEHKEAPKTPPTFMPLGEFTVNLADREQDRYAQIAIDLQISDAKVAEQLKLYQRAIYGDVLMAITRKTSTELLSFEGKEKLQWEVMREVVRPLGIELEEPQDHANAEGDSKPKKKKKKKVNNPVDRVIFTKFIIQ